jgi:hypothetical protein
MIFDLIPNPHNTWGKILIPTWNSPIDAVELHDMLVAMFPYCHETYGLNLWGIFLICWDGYDNAIEFT